LRMAARKRTHTERKSAFIPKETTSKRESGPGITAAQNKKKGKA